jgi:hypothetical protein
MKRWILFFCCFEISLWAQEARSGFDLGATLSTGADYSHQLEAEPRDGGPLTGGFRAVLYPTWKLSEHWAITGAVQVSSRPYFFDQFSTQGYGVKADLLQANLSYSRFWKRASVVVRLGQMPSAFGSFLLRYDDAVNPLIGVHYGIRLLRRRCYGIGLGRSPGRRHTRKAGHARAVCKLVSR